jgi:hypothetical protein
MDNSIIKNKKVLRLVGLYKGIRLIFKDSLAIIPKALKTFPSMFGFEEIKEIFPYRYYDSQMNQGEFIKGIKTEASKYVPDTEREYFLQNVNRREFIHDDPLSFDMQKYCVFYCERDVDLLQRGYMAFRDYILRQFHLDIINFVSISSVANEIMCIKCYFPNGNLYDLSGPPRSFIAKCIHGGRCICKPVYTVEPIICLDAVSLYPSAMKRLYCLEGMPEVLEPKQLNQNYLLRHLFDDDQWTPNIDKFISGFFIEYEICGFREREFPILPNLEKGEHIFIDHIQLEDLVKFCGMKGKVIRGYYYSGNRDPKIREVIEEIFQLRVANKKTPIEQIMKIVLNSIYGKTILKPITNDIKFVDTKNINRYIQRHYNNIISAETITYGEEEDKFTKVKTKKLLYKHQNFTPLGCNILSMSKRIMNEVFTLAEDNGIKIYYTDTDSLYIGLKDEKHLEDLFYETYGRVMTGTSLGQFHRDFPQVCTKSIFVWKKVYCNLLDDGTYHYRLKGICQDVIDLKAAEMGISLMDLYDRLLGHEEIIFDVCQSSRPSIETNNFEAYTRASFMRKIKF